MRRKWVDEVCVLERLVFYGCIGLACPVLGRDLHSYALSPCTSVQPSIHLTDMRANSIGADEYVLQPSNEYFWDSWSNTRWCGHGT